jgi:hypothetical protein
MNSVVRVAYGQVAKAAVSVIAADDTPSGFV